MAEFLGRGARRAPGQGERTEAACGGLGGIRPVAPLIPRDGILAAIGMTNTGYHEFGNVTVHLICGTLKGVNYSSSLSVQSE